MTLGEEDQTDQTKTGGVKGTVARVIEIIRHFADGPEEWALTDLADTLGLPFSTTHRLLRLLQLQGVVEWDPQSHHYRSGVELYRMAALLSARIPIVHMATPLLQEIVARCDESALLGLYLPAQRQMIVAAKIDGSNPVRYVEESNIPRTIAWGATGRAILAYLPKEELDRVLSREERSPATQKALNPDEAHQELAEIRQRGYAFSRGQRTAEAVGIAAPFFGANGTVLGDICLTIPAFRFRSGSETELAALLISKARQLSDLLGAAGSAKNNHNRDSKRDNQQREK
jgi:DNA-binding IclR family transcriptional regulator